MHKRASFWIGLIVTAFLVLSLWLMMGHYHHEITKPQHTSTQSPDAFMNNVHYRNFNPQGLLSGQITSPKAVHYPKENVTVFTKPKVLLKTSNDKPWYVTANNGRSRDGDREVFLWGNVLVHQPATKTTINTVIKTTQLTIHPNQETASTTQPVTIIRPGSHTHAIGLKANFKTGVFQLLSHARGNYAPSDHQSH